MSNPLSLDMHGRGLRPGRSSDGPAGACPSPALGSIRDPSTKKLPTCVNRWGALAVAEGFEPSDGGYPSHAFEACSLGRSDTPPLVTLPDGVPVAEIARWSGIT